METDIQRSDTRKLKSFIARNSLVSVMNNTKWEKLRSLMLDEAEKLPSWKFKSLMDSYNEECRWELEWRYHIPNFKTVEWLDINPRKIERRGKLLKDTVTDHSDYFSQIIYEIKINFRMEAGNIRIWGYMWPSASVTFVLPDQSI